MPTLEKRVYLKVNPSTPEHIVEKVKSFLREKDIPFTEQEHYEKCYSYFAFENDWVLDLFEEMAQAINLTPKKYEWPEWDWTKVPKNELSAFSWSSNTIYLNSPFFADPDENY